MANSTAPFGLKPINSLAGTASGAAKHCATDVGDANAIYVGDPVEITGTGAGKRPVVTRATAGTGNAISGVVVGLEVDNDDLNSKYRKANSTRGLIVDFNPSTVYQIRAKDAFAITDIGSNVNVDYGTANPTYGLSGVTADAANAGTGATLQLRIQGVLDREENDVGANAILEVTINNNATAPNKAGV